MLLVRAAEDERRHSNGLPYLMSCRGPVSATTRAPPPPPPLSLPPECQDEILLNSGQELMAEVLSSCWTHYGVTNKVRQGALMVEYWRLSGQLLGAETLRWGGICPRLCDQGHGTREWSGNNNQACQWQAGSLVDEGAPGLHPGSPCEQYAGGCQPCWTCARLPAPNPSARPLTMRP